MYPYHNHIKRRIKNGELLDCKTVSHYKDIGECMLLLFSTPPFIRPIRPERYGEYEKILREWREKNP